MTAAESSGPVTSGVVPEGVSGLDLPLGRRVELPGRGVTFVREVAGPGDDAPVLLLLHGWFASGGLNWYQAFGPLSEHFRIIAPDLRGHGRGLRTRRRFRLSDCADDVDALMDQLGIDGAVACGYSMGGPVAQLLWKRHPERVRGLVFAATSSMFVPGLQNRMVFAGAMAAVAGTTRAAQVTTRLPGPVRHMVPKGLRGADRPTRMQTWAAQEMRRHDYRMVMEAGTAIATYSSHRWIGGVDVPTTVLVTTKDRAIPPHEQLRLALAIPHAKIHRYEEGHTSPVLASFGSAITEACRSVLDHPSTED